MFILIKDYGGRKRSWYDQEFLAGIRRKTEEIKERRCAFVFFSSPSLLLLFFHQSGRFNFFKMAPFRCILYSGRHGDGGHLRVELNDTKKRLKLKQKKRSIPQWSDDVTVSCVWSEPSGSSTSHLAHVITSSSSIRRENHPIRKKISPNKIPEVHSKFRSMFFF